MIFKGDGEIQDFNGNYLEWRVAKELEESKAKDERMKTKQLKQEEEKSTSQVKKLSYKEKLELEKLEKEIERLEHEKKELGKKLSEGTGDHGQIFQWSQRYQEVELDLDVKSMRWLELSS